MQCCAVSRSESTFDFLARRTGAAWCSSSWASSTTSSARERSSCLLSFFSFFAFLLSGISHLMSKCTRTWWHDFSFSRLTSLCCVQMHQIAQLTSGYSGSDLAALARDAAYGPIRCQPHLPANIFLFLLLQRAEDRWGEVFGPCEPEEDQHERLPRSHETDKKVRGHIVHWRDHSSSLFPRSVSADSLVPYEAWNQKFGEGAT